MKNIIRQSKKDSNNKKNIIKQLISNLKWVIFSISNEGGKQHETDYQH